MALISHASKSISLKTPRGLRSLICCCANSQKTPNNKSQADCRSAGATRQRAALGGYTPNPALVGCHSLGVLGRTHPQAHQIVLAAVSHDQSAP